MAGSAANEDRVGNRSHLGTNHLGHRVYHSGRGGTLAVTRNFPRVSDHLHVREFLDALHWPGHVSVEKASQLPVARDCGLCLGVNQFPIGGLTDKQSVVDAGLRNYPDLLLQRSPWPGDEGLLLRVLSASHLGTVYLGFGAGGEGVVQESETQPFEASHYWWGHHW